MSNYRKALILTAIPIVVLCLISIGLMFAHYDRLGEQIGWGASGLLVISIVAAIVCNIRGMKQIAKGIWKGFIIGFVALIVTFVWTSLAAI
ncbi:MAG TPA: hypothetical protein G4O19_03865 [Dehalococcoidia bacterium]|nr:hypothetical protein [Dehalococcoidia bacterium]